MATPERVASLALPVDMANQARAATVDTANQARADTTPLTTTGALPMMTGAHQRKMTGAPLRQKMTGAPPPMIGLDGTHPLMIGPAGTHPLMIGPDLHGEAEATGPRYPLTTGEVTTAARVARAVRTDTAAKVARAVRTDTANQARDPRVDTTVRDAALLHPSSNTSMYPCPHPATLPLLLLRHRVSPARVIMMMTITTASLERVGMARASPESQVLMDMAQESLASRVTKDESVESLLRSRMEKTLVMFDVVGHMITNDVFI